jgi:hypothetical protein
MSFGLRSGSSGRRCSVAIDHDVGAGHQQDGQVEFEAQHVSGVIVGDAGRRRANSAIASSRADPTSTSTPAPIAGHVGPPPLHR